MNKAYLSLGSNRGNRANNLKNAAKWLLQKAGTITLASSIYETQPWKMNDETNFFNQVLLLETALAPSVLMDAILQIESDMGRIRTPKKYQPRIIDIDILFFNNEIINTHQLHIPHPLMHLRMFILKPLAEIAPEYIHPLYKKNIQKLLSECQDKNKIKKLIPK